MRDDLRDDPLPWRRDALVCGWQDRTTARRCEPGCDLEPLADGGRADGENQRILERLDGWTTPGDDSTAVDTRNSGNGFKISAPSFGVINHDAGLSQPDETHHGILGEFPFTPEIEAALCAALTA